MIPAALLTATGAAISLWACHLGTGEITRGLSWLFGATVAASWPAYLGWRFSTRASRTTATVAAYHEGYTDGYLRGVSDRIEGVSTFTEGYADGFLHGMSGGDQP